MVWFRIIAEVALDLWRFATGKTVSSSDVVAATSVSPYLLTTPPTRTALPNRPYRAVFPLIEDEPVLLPPTPAVAAEVLPQSVIAVEVAAVHTDPVVGFDNVSTTLAYGTAVRIGSRIGRWVEVTAGITHGWVLAEEVGDSKTVLPQLVHGKIYSEATDAHVVRLREVIGDSFSAGRSGLGLRSEEYVTYMLWVNGRRIPWPEEGSQRVAGSWQRKLRGVSGVHIDIRPRTDSVMEYIIDDIGYLGYVHEVSPEETITVSAVGLTHEHQYTYERFDRSVWRELRPVFISIV